MGQDWSRWLDETSDADVSSGSRPRGRAPVVRLRKGRRDDGEDSGLPRPILVVGGCGGSGTTTTALGLAGELGAEAPAVAVDATVAGSDLALRGADEHLSPISLQQWLYGRGDDEPAPLKECLSRASSGIGLLWRDASPLRRRATYLTVARAVADAGFTPVYDGGNPIAARQLRPLLEDAEVALVLAIPARADAANRLRVTLEWLDDEFGGHAEGQGGGIVGDTTIVVSHQLPGNDSRVADHLREHLTGWVSDIREVPYDPQLARGELVRHNALDAETRRAYRRLLTGMAS
ncbi:hypothetical protein [Nocardia spumae]|uniref:hypothetical protein n=1 Tax=Nocardia spumae TaxID=2887190 RepID=UPI001D15611A|nr:hypothetical protein [Nocardia spumae]